MVYFLTSSPCLPDSPALNPANGFVDELKKALPGPCRALFVCSDPDRPDRTRGFAEDMRSSFARIGVRFTHVQVLERANQERCGELIAGAELIFLVGGHVPTQNEFFQEIDLREELRNWDGVLVGVSAGSMNAAGVVYAQPEEPGEAVDPEYRRFLPGLGLTKTMLLPHYQMVRDTVLDGLRLYEDITYADSVGRRFYVLVDGSYLLGKYGGEELRGEAYLIENGALTQICRENERITL